MTNTQLTSLLKHQVEILPFYRDVDFALDICKRLLPEYIIFSQRNNWGDPRKLNKAISFCEKNRSSLKVEDTELKNHLSGLEAVTPDTEDFGDWDGSYALNAAGSVLELLKYFQDRSKSHILNISTFMTDNIDFKLSEANEALSNEQLKEHPNILKELLYQLEITK
jgi:uncharacterized protein